MFSTRHLALVALAGALATLPSAASAARDPGVLQQKKPNVTYVFNTDFNVPVDPVPQGKAVGVVVAINTASATSGCDAAEFAGLPANRIVVVVRGGCTFAQKVLNAQAGGAEGVLIANNEPGLANITFAGADITIPVLSITHELGLALTNPGNAHVHMLVRRP